MEKKAFEQEYKKIGARIVYWRTLRGMSQVLLADKSTLCRSRLSEIEHGKGACSVETLLLICDAFDITLTEFFTPIMG